MPWVDPWHVKFFVKLKAWWCIYVCVNWIIIGVKSGQRQVIIWNNAELLSIGHSRANFSKISTLNTSIFIEEKLFKNVFCQKMAAILCWLQCVKILTADEYRSKSGCHSQHVCEMYVWQVCHVRVISGFVWRRGEAGVMGNWKKKVISASICVWVPSIHPYIQTSIHPFYRTHCGLVTPYGDIDLDQHSLR